MYQDKLQAVKTILRGHYRDVNAKWTVAEVEAEVETFLTHLNQIGGTSDTNLESLQESDLTDVLPKLVARQIVKVFGGGREEIPRQVVLIDDDPDKLARRMKPAELVGEYSPDEADDAFGMRLKTISSGKPFLIFNADGTVNVPISVKLLQELRDGYSPRTSVIVGEVPCQPYVVGNRPARYADEHPLFKGVMLRPDGYSDSGIYWKALTLELRQLLHIAANLTGEVVLNQGGERYYFDMVRNETLEQASQRFPKAYLKYQELAGANSVPSLRVILKPAT